MRKLAMVLGGSGQAGSYMCEFLTAKGYGVYAPWRMNADLESPDFIGMFKHNLDYYRPSEIYNFAAKTSKKESWEDPAGFMYVNGLAVLQMLDAVKRYRPEAKFFNAGSADVFSRRSLFGRAMEDSDRGPSNPYGLSKCVAEDAVSFYRYRGLHASTGIFFNMESPRRRDVVFTKMVVREVGRICRSLDAGIKPEPAVFGDLSVERDWGLASEYVEAAWLMLQEEEPRDFVVATGETHSCLDFVHEAFEVAEVTEAHLEIPPVLRTNDIMAADPSYIKRMLGWEAKSKFKQVVRTLVEAELAKPKESAVGQGNTTRLA